MKCQKSSLAFQVSDKDSTGTMTFLSKDSHEGDRIGVDASDNGPVGGLSGTNFLFNSQKHSYRLTIDLDEFGCDNCD